VGRCRNAQEFVRLNARSVRRLLDLENVWVGRRSEEELKVWCWKLDEMRFREGGNL